MKWLLAITVCISVATASDDRPRRLAQGLPLVTFEGRAIDIRSLSDTQPLIILRYLGASCSHCIDQLLALRESSERIRTAGLHVIAMSHDDPHTCAMAMQRLALDSTWITLCSDNDNNTATALGCVIDELDTTTTNLHMVMVAHKRQVLFEHYSLVPLMAFDHVINVADSARHYEPLSR